MNAKQTQPEHEATLPEAEALAEEAAREALEAEVNADETASQTEKTAVDEVTEWKERAYRLAADMENLKKRTRKEVEDARQFAVASFARELLNVQDNFERALEELKKQEETEENTAQASLKTMKEGVAMVAHQMGQTLQKFQITVVKSVGEKFDPECHQAMFEVPTNEQPAGTVVQEIQKGYRIGERLLRPAMVGVAKKMEA